MKVKSRSFDSVRTSPGDVPTPLGMTKQKWEIEISRTCPNSRILTADG
jgi:hypothetical protein